MKQDKRVPVTQGRLLTGEIIRIGDEIEITVLSVKGNQVRLGITAPDEVAVHREEIYVKIQEEMDSPLH